MLFSISRTRRIFGRPKPAPLGVGTNKVYGFGQVTRSPTKADGLIPTEYSNPIILLPIIMPWIPAKALWRAVDPRPLYTTFIMFWKEVSAPACSDTTFERGLTRHA